jgi:hypothetical protein
MKEELALNYERGKESMINSEAIIIGVSPEQ